MPHAHPAVPATFPPPMPPSAASFADFLARHDLPRAEALPPRAASLAWAAYCASPRYVGHSVPPRAMVLAHIQCREFRAGLLGLARAVVACERGGAAS